MRLVSFLTILIVFVLAVRAEDGQLQKEQLILKTTDGLAIHANRVTSGNESVLIYCHRLLGSHNDIDINGYGKVFLEDFDVLTFDFRGHGKSEGYSTCGGDEVLDLLSAVQYAREAGYRRIVVLGMGMGGTVAIRQAALFGNVDAVVAMSPLGRPKRFRPWSWRTTSKLSAKSDYVRLPIRIINGTKIGGFYLTGSPVSLVDRVTPIPLLIIHGEDSQYLNFRRTQELYEQAAEPKKLVILSPPEYANEPVNDRSAEVILEWLKEAMPDKSSPETVIPVKTVRLSIPIKDVELRGDVVLPEKTIKDVVNYADKEAAGLNDQIVRIREAAEALYNSKGYSLSHVSAIQLSKDGLLSLEMEVDRIHRLVTEGNRQATSEQIWQELQTEEGDYYNSWEIEKSMKKLSRLSAIADFENRLDRSADRNTLRILIKEQRQWSISPTIKIDSFDNFGGLSFHLNKYRQDSWRIFSSSLVGLEHHNLIYRLRIEKSWLDERSLSTRFDFEQFINRRGILNYYFARQEARERGGGIGSSYRVSDNVILHCDFIRKKFAPVGGDAALPVGEGIIDSVSLRLENRGQLLERDDSAFGLLSQSFVEAATKVADGDYDYTVVQLNLYPQLILSSSHVLNFGMHWGKSWGDLPPQKMLSLGGIRTMPAYGYDAFVGEHIFLLRSRYDLKFGRWLGNTSRWEPLAISLLFDAGDARSKEESLKFGDPRLGAGIELSYASVIQVAIFKSIGRDRTAPYFYFGWYPNIFLLKS